MKQEIIELIKEEIRKLTPGVKYTILYLGYLYTLLITNTLSDSDLKNILKITNLSDLAILLIVILPSILYAYFIFSKIRSFIKKHYLMSKYPISQINTNYSLISFKGKLFLFDHEKKEMKWIKSWLTAVDLNFVGEWTWAENIDIDAPSSYVNTTITTKEGKKIKVKDYIYTEGIHTQGIQGF